MPFILFLVIPLAAAIRIIAEAPSIFEKIAGVILLGAIVGFGALFVWLDDI